VMQATLLLLADKEETREKTTHGGSRPASWLWRQLSMAGCPLFWPLPSVFQQDVLTMLLEGMAVIPEDCASRWGFQTLLNPLNWRSGEVGPEANHQDYCSLAHACLRRGCWLQKWIPPTFWVHVTGNNGATITIHISYSHYIVLYFFLSTLYHPGQQVQYEYIVLGRQVHNLK
jgi:hypothetical protein